jgi:transposase
MALRLPKGRDFAAWLGLAPKQMSTGDRTILGRISKRSNRYLGTLFMQGARVILLRPANWAKHSFWAVAYGRGKTATSRCSCDCAR